MRQPSQENQVQSHGNAAPSTNSTHTNGTTTPSHTNGVRPEEKAPNYTVTPDRNSSGQSPTPQKTTPRSTSGRRGSWISNLSAKFSSGSTPPSQTSAKTSPSAPKTAIHGGSKLDFHNPFGAAYSPKVKEEEEKEEGSNPFSSTSPKGPSFLHNALRRFSSSAPSGVSKAAPSGTLCERRVMNIDPCRDRCKIPELKQAKLRRVAFCVDVEIAGISYREPDDETSPTRTVEPHVVESNGHKGKKSKEKFKTKPETQNTKDGPAAKTAAKKDPNGANETKIEVEVKEPTRKQEKKKRSEEERKERKERRRRQAEANGIVPLQLNYAEGDSPSAINPRPKPQSQPVTDPVRIYRRCCKLRESPVLKKVVDQISSPSSTLAESPGTVAVLDLSNFPMTYQDIITFSDWLAIVPVRKLILDSCCLTDQSVRAILAGLLSTKTVEEMTSRRKRNGKSVQQKTLKEDTYGVIEKLSLKNNHKIGAEGWRHICLFVHMSKSLRAIDLTGVPFPKPRAAANGPEDPSQTNKPPIDVSAIFSNSLAERFGGDRLEELLLSECNPTTEDVRKVCDAAIAVGLRRLGFANNGLTREGFEHVIRYLKAGKCEGLDLGGNDLRDHLDLLIPILDKDHPLYTLSLADCSLTPVVMQPLMQGLARLPHLHFVDFSHNRELFSSKPDALATFRRYLPKMSSLKRIHLADVDLSATHTIALAEVLPECPRLCHLNITENPTIVKLASASDPASQEEACAVYASLMAAVRVSRTIIAVDIEVPGAESNEVVKALASQIVAYSLRNLEHGALEEELPVTMGPSAERQVPVPEVLQHLVGHGDGEEGEDETDHAPDEDYVIGGTGVVKALGVCLGTVDNIHGDLSVPTSGTSTPIHRRQRPLMTKRPHDMSKNLLESARNIRTRLQSALVREDRAGNDTNYRRLLVLDYALNRIIKRFEDQFPETRVVSRPAPSITQETGSNSSDDHSETATAVGLISDNHAGSETAIDDEDIDHYDITLSRSSSMTSLHSRAMTSEEGQIHRLGQNLRRDFLSPSLDRPSDHLSSSPIDDSHIISLREKLEQLQREQMAAGDGFETGHASKAIERLGWTVDELWDTKKWDTEAYTRFKESQIAAQINSGMRKPPLTEVGMNGTTTERNAQERT